jgi:hypothetical protein
VWRTFFFSLQIVELYSTVIVPGLYNGPNLIGLFFFSRRHFAVCCELVLQAWFALLLFLGLTRSKERDSIFLSLFFSLERL